MPLTVKDDDCAKSGNSVLSRMGRMRPRTRSLLFAARSVPLHAMITSVGVQDIRDRSYDWDGRKRGSAPYVLWQYTLRGSGRLIYEGRAMQVEPGTAMVLHFPHAHRYWYEPHIERGRIVPWRFFYLCLHGHEVLRLWHAAESAAGPLMPCRDSDVTVQAAHTCASALAGEIDSAWQASALAYSLACAVAGHAMSRHRDASGGARPAPIDHAIALVRERFAQSIGVAEMAEAAGLSRFHFSRVFKSAEGVSPAEYLLRHRLRQAARQLRETRDPVKTIAHRCGFADANYFAKAFRRVYHVSPTDLRRSGMY